MPVVGSSSLTIHKFTEDIQLPSDRSNIICISDEAHRSQISLDLKLSIDAEWHGEEDLRLCQIPA